LGSDTPSRALTTYYLAEFKTKYASHCVIFGKNLGALEVPSPEPRVIT